MKMRFIAVVILGLTIHSASTSPIPGCDCKSSPAPEVYTQNDGKPVVLYAYGDTLSPADGSASNDAQPADGGDCNQAVAVPYDQSSDYERSDVPVADVSNDDSSVAAVPADASDSDDSQSEMDQAQVIADSLPDAQSDSVQQSNEPCKVETNTEVVQTPGETFVHHPGPIYINQPPTRLIIKHAPYIVRPSPIVVNQGGKTITKAYTTKYLPSPVHVRPVIVRLVKPITKKVLIEKPAKPCQPVKSVVVAPEIPNPCDDVGPAATPAPAPSPAPCASNDGGVELDSVASVDAVELQNDDGELYGYETAKAVGNCGCQ